MSETQRQQQQQQQQQPAQSLTAPPASARVVVVGGGLAGLVAALQAAECLDATAATVATAITANGSCPAVHCPPGSGDKDGGGAAAAGGYAVDVLLVDKMPKLGGNSMKASSGINALNPEAGDSIDLFASDTLASGGGLSRPELVAALVRDSPAALSFLSGHGVALGGVTRLGGHSVPRTRTVVGGANVGFAIMSALIARAQAHPRIRLLPGHTIRRIVTGPADAAAAEGGAAGVVAVELAVAAPDGSAAAAAGGAGAGAAARVAVVSCGSLVLATGGFAANKEMLQSVAPAAAALATTNGPWARGEALALAKAAGAELEGLDQVQVHPTGFVDPADPNAGTKFLAPEKLRGAGGLLLNNQGARFVDELGRRDVVAGAVGGLPGSAAWLLLGREAAAEFGGGPVDFYCKRGLMRRAENLSELAAALGGGATEGGLRAELLRYAAEAEAAEAAEEGLNARGRKAAYPHPPHPDTQWPMYLARVTPVVHYTMGGVAINERAQALRAAGGGAGAAVVPGLYAAGEASGGLHGSNRLGGNSLLECVVFGRIAGAQAAAAAPCRL